MSAPDLAVVRFGVAFGFSTGRHGHTFARCDELGLGVPPNGREWSCDRFALQEASAFYDDVAHYTKTARSNWLDGLLDVLNLQQTF